MIPYPIPLRFQLKEEEENGVLGVLCVERESVAKIMRRGECGQLIRELRGERESWEKKEGKKRGNKREKE